MPDLSGEPVRVSRARAMELLCIGDERTFKKVVDANPRLKHKLPGETRSKYLTSVIAELLSSSRCPAEGEVKTIADCGLRIAESQRQRTRSK